MTEKRSKYDTDPLDPDFVRRTQERMGGSTSAPTSDVSRERPTEPISQPTERIPAPQEILEDPTRRLGEMPTPSPATQPFTDAARRTADEPYPPSSYPSVFVPPVYQPPASQNPYANPTPPHGTHAAQPPQVPYGAQSAKPSKRQVAGLGLPENISMVLPYAPFYVGIVASLVELLFVPRSEHRVRFHAAQGLALQLAMLAVSFFFGLVRTVTDSSFGGWLFSLAAFIFLLVSMIRVWNGEQHRIAPLDELRRKIDRQFEPRQEKR